MCIRDSPLFCAIHFLLNSDYVGEPKPEDEPITMDDHCAKRALEVVQLMSLASGNSPQLLCYEEQLEFLVCKCAPDPAGRILGNIICHIQLAWPPTPPSSDDEEAP